MKEEIENYANGALSYRGVQVEQGVREPSGNQGRKLSYAVRLAEEARINSNLSLIISSSG